MPVEGRPVLLTHNDLVARIIFRDGMLAPAGHEMLPVQNAVIFIGDQGVQYILVFGARHHAQIFESIRQIAAVIHVDVRGAAIPAQTVHVDAGSKCQRDLAGFAGDDLCFFFRRLVGKSLDGFDAYFPRR